MSLGIYVVRDKSFCGGLIILTDEETEELRKKGYNVKFIRRATEEDIITYLFMS
ncbi:hypothetical protein ACO3UB_08355 (plasmid) [Methanocaldococcus sp. 16A]